MADGQNEAGVREHLEDSSVNIESLVTQATGKGEAIGSELDHSDVAPVKGTV